MIPMLEATSKSPRRFWLRFSLPVALIVVAGLFLQLRGSGNRPSLHARLSHFPRQVQGWQGQTIDIPPEIRKILGPGQFLERLYRHRGTAMPVDLFLAYFPNQRSGDTMHSPKNCLPGGGWVPIAVSHLSVAGLDGKHFTVNRYLIAKGLDRMLVLYWFEEQGRTVASEYWAKAYLVADAIRENRTDGALIRVATPLAPGENPASAEKRAVRFTHAILPLLPAHIPG